jgi:ADP-heptose:LPS heptosyltransferase
LKLINLPSKEWDELTPEDVGGKRSEKTVCIVRYGGFGDMIQVSSLFPLFKEQGYRVCLNVSDRGYDVVKSDPHIDEILLQQTDQVPNDCLTMYWERLAKCFHHFVQLCESIEGSLLVTPARTEMLRGEQHLVPANPRFGWDKEKLHEECNVNYMERTHDLGSVPFLVGDSFVKPSPLPYKFSPKFYPTKKEKKWAKTARKRIKTKNLILWSLSGSSVHKVYPWTDAVIASVLMERNDVSFLTIGDDLCQLLECGWEDEKRVITKSGKWSIRKTLAFLDECDIVVGPETGVLNAASTLDCHKTVMLSHSSEENLSKHWKNTTTLGPEYYPDFCFPCHKMHYGFDTCNRDEETGGAMCAAKIKPQIVIDDILGNLR